MSTKPVQISLDRELLARIDRDPQAKKQGARRSSAMRSSPRTGSIQTPYISCPITGRRTDTSSRRSPVASIGSRSAARWQRGGVGGAVAGGIGGAATGPGAVVGALAGGVGGAISGGVYNAGQQFGLWR